MSVKAELQLNRVNSSDTDAPFWDLNLFTVDSRYLELAYLE